MRHRRITLRILLYYIGMLLVTLTFGLLLFVQGTTWAGVAICGWLLSMLFLSWKLRQAFRSQRMYHPGEWAVYDVDDISGTDFEELTCDILAANGFDLAENTQLSRDFGVDVLARKDGISYAIQCKRYTSPVGIDAVQQVYAGRAYYECHVAMVLSNQYFTSGARKLADKLGVVLWDRDRLEELLR